MPKITELWALVIEAEPGNEAVPAMLSVMGPVPLVGADVQRMESFDDVAQQIADREGKQVQLRRFREMEVVRAYEPTPRPKGKG